MNYNRDPVTGSSTLKLNKTTEKEKIRWQTHKTQTTLNKRKNAKN